MNGIYSPCALTDVIRKTLENRLPFVWVRGEISNLARAASGHIYFSLKDAQAQIQCVWFAGRQRQGGQGFDPLTGEVYAGPQPSPAEILANGMEALCAGAVNIYAARSQYQLNVELMQPAGAGALALEFEARKKRLAAAGYFDVARKRSLPSNPLRIAVVASPAGAAIHDFLELARNRGLSVVIRLYPAPAQGADAAGIMADQIQLINRQGWAQVIVLIRGGGSLEDLWAFNEEPLVEAIFSSRLPIIAGIGHEIDFTLADMTADVRAATPSHAAQLLWPQRRDLWQRLDQAQMRLEREIGQSIERFCRDFDRLDKALDWLSPLQQLRRLLMQLDQEDRKLQAAAAVLFKRLDSSYERLASVFAAPDRLLAKMDAADLRRSWLADALDKNMGFRLAGLLAALEKQEANLRQLDPSAPLQRGYAMLFAGERVVGSVEDVVSGQEIKAVLQDGALDLSLIKTIKKSPRSGGSVFDNIGTRHEK